MILADIFKGINRLVHLTAGCFLIGNSISNVIWTERDMADYIEAYIFFGLALLVTGVINILMVKPLTIMEENDKRIWNYLMYGKAVLWIFFIPIPDIICEASGRTFPRTELNAALALLTLILSIIAKTFRDTKTIKIQ